jgi:UDPglucose--hexose-1-phosphate uridylyltransferase
MVWEQRWHPLRREWVIVSAHRNDRPWQGEVVPPPRDPATDYAPECYLCPGNQRVSGKTNERYNGIFVFDNDHPCVAPGAPRELERAPGVYRNRPATGLARVVCYSPRHDLTLTEMPEVEIIALLETLQAQYRELGALDGVRHVLVFENKGEVTGVSNPHPHCQIYATNFVFRVVEQEAEAQNAYLTEHGRVLFQDIIATEEADGRRMIARRDRAVAFVPYFARYPYETFIAPRVPHPSLAELGAGEIADLASVLKETLVRLDNLWRMPFPYVAVFHQAPTDGAKHPGFHTYIQILPPLRKPGLLKYLAGPEIGGGNFLNDTAAEAKAAELRAVSPVHYKLEAAGGG